MCLLAKTEVSSCQDRNRLFFVVFPDRHPADFRRTFFGGKLFVESFSVNNISAEDFRQIIFASVRGSSLHGQLELISEAVRGSSPCGRLEIISLSSRFAPHESTLRNCGRTILLD